MIDLKYFCSEYIYNKNLWVKIECFSKSLLQEPGIKTCINDLPDEVNPYKNYEFIDNRFKIPYILYSIFCILEHKHRHLTKKQSILLEFYNIWTLHRFYSVRQVKFYTQSQNIIINEKNKQNTKQQNRTSSQIIDALWVYNMKSFNNPLPDTQTDIERIYEFVDIIIEYSIERCYDENSAKIKTHLNKFNIIKTYLRDNMDICVMYFIYYFGYGYNNCNFNRTIPIPSNVEYLSTTCNFNELVTERVFVPYTEDTVNQLKQKNTNYVNVIQSKFKL